MKKQYIIISSTDGREVKFEDKDPQMLWNALCDLKVDDTINIVTEEDQGNSDLVTTRNIPVLFVGEDRTMRPHVHA